MKNELSRRPYFVLLLPVFFVFHGFAQNFQYLGLVDVLYLAGMYTAASLVVYLLALLPFRNAVKAGLFAGFLMAFFFFFGSIFDTLKAHAPFRWMYKYSVLLSFSGLTAVILFIFLYRTKRSFGKTALFLNILFICFLLLDLGTILYKSMAGSKEEKKITASGPDLIPAGVHKPDIYLLLFDEYAGNLALDQWLNYDNTAKDSFLLSKGFFVAKTPFSNYEYTAFSMASMLNMDYIPWEGDTRIPTREELVECGTRIKHNRAVSFLNANGYEIVNNSIFDLDKHPAHINQRFLPVNTRLISEETLIYRLSIHFEWWLSKQPLLKKLLPVEAREDEIANIERAIDLTMKEPLRKSDRPKFVYCHFMVPHLPAFLDSIGQRLPPELLGKGPTIKDHYDSYLGNLRLANHLIRQMVTQIQEATDHQAVIIVMSDHGIRWPRHTLNPRLATNNLNAVFLPGRQYAGWTNSVTNVNQFRILFNTLFDQQYKLLPDKYVKMGHRP